MFFEKDLPCEAIPLKYPKKLWSVMELFSVKYRRLLAVNYFPNELHHRCLKRSYIRFGKTINDMSHMICWHEVLFIKKKQFRQRIGLGIRFQFSIENETNISFNPSITNLTKSSNILKQIVGNSRQIVWVGLTILWGWRLQG